MTGGTAVLAAEGLEARRGEFVLSVPRLAVGAGETWALLGANGAGKTTLLRLLDLLDVPERGEVRIGGRVGRNAAERVALRRRLGVALQDVVMFSGTVEENVRLGLALRGVGRAEARRAAGGWIERLGLGGVARRDARTLSGGEAQRLALARALAVRPEALLLDEPFRSLDRPTRTELLRDLGEILAAEGIATVLATHDRDEAAQLAPHWAVLVRGRLAQAGPSREVLDHPASEEVGRLAGMENVFAATPGPAGGLVSEGIAVPVAAPAAGPLRFGVRPERVRLRAPCAPAAGPGEVEVPGRIARVSATGTGWRVEVAGALPLVAVVLRGMDGEPEPRPGDEVRAAFSASAVHVFRSV